MSAVEQARAVRIEDELARRGVKLKRVSSTERAGPCPKCGGIDRFSVNVRKAVWNCRACAQGGDVLALVLHLDGCSFTEAVERLTGQRPHSAPERPVETPPDRRPSDIGDAAKTRAALRMWDEAGPIEGTLAEVYLRRTRRLDLPHDVSGRVLRFHPACPFGPDEKRPCLVSIYRSIVNDAPVAIHRTALTADAQKIDRKMLGPVKGAAIKLSAHEEVECGLTVGEGLETAVAAMMEGFRPAWALTSAGAIRDFPVLAGVEALTIVVDHDEADSKGRQAGQEAASVCSERWRLAGREVLRVVPNGIGEDMADVIGGRNGRGC